MLSTVYSSSVETCLKEVREPSSDMKASAMATELQQQQQQPQEEEDGTRAGVQDEVNMIVSSEEAAKVNGGKFSLEVTGDGQQVQSMVSRVLTEAAVYGIAIGYCLSASLLSIINKWAIMKFPYPGSLTALQYLTSALGVWILGRLKLLEHDTLRLDIMWRFLPAALCFYMSLFTNSELLLHANVDTFIVFRSAVPILVAVGETLFLKQPWPSPKTWLSLAVILLGAVVYVLTDSQFALNTYSWAVAYLVSMTVDFVYIKHIVMTIGLNTWGLVLYNNLEALLLYPFELLLTGEGLLMKSEAEHHALDWYSFSVWLPVALSCLFGLSISFFGFSCRKGISATSFTVLGVVNKLLTVAINLVIWKRHASALGTVGLLTCIGGGIAYQQSLSKPVKAQPVVENDEEKQPLKPEDHEEEQDELS